LAKLSEVPWVLVATRLPKVCGKPDQLAKILTPESKVLEIRRTNPIETQWQG
jgi:hypothetical protein